MKDNPVLRCLDGLKQLSGGIEVEEDWDSMEELLERLAELCGEEGSGNAAIATRNGAVELVCCLCSKIRVERRKVLVSALKAMAVLLHGKASLVDEVWL